MNFVLDSVKSLLKQISSHDFIGNIRISARLSVKVDNKALVDITLCSLSLLSEPLIFIGFDKKEKILTL